MRIHNPCRRTLKTPHRSVNALALPLNLVFTDPSHGHTNLLSAEPLNLLKRGALLLGLRDDPLARVAEADIVARAELVQQVLAADAQAGLEGRGAVVDARVDDLAVARGGFGADGGVALEEEGGGGGSAAGELLGYCKSYCAAADDLWVVSVYSWLTFA